MTKSDKIDEEKNETTEIPNDDDNEATTGCENKTNKKTDTLENKDQNTQPSIRHINVISNTVIKQADQHREENLAPSSSSFERHLMYPAPLQKATKNQTEKCPVPYLQDSEKTITIKNMKPKR